MNQLTFVTAGFAIVLFCGYMIGRSFSAVCTRPHFPPAAPAPVVPKRDARGRFIREE